MQKQNLENFLVAILDATKKIIGTGFFISQDGIIATACHVIYAALQLPLSTEETPENYLIYVQFSNDNTTQLARILKEYCNKTYDVAFLKIDNIPKKLISPVFGDSLNSIGNIFVSSGYREPSGGAIGRIAPYELTQNPTYKRLILNSDQINKGMSGAPILDLDRNLVIGMIVSTWYGDNRTGKDRCTAFAVTSEILKHIYPVLEIKKEITQENSLETITSSLTNLPSKRTQHFIGRKQIQKDIVSMINSTFQKILISGVGGIGKTTLALEIAHYFLEKTNYFNAIIWLSSETDFISLDSLFDTLFEVFDLDAFINLSIDDKQIKALRILRKNSVLFVLDGFEDSKDFDLIRMFSFKTSEKCKYLITSRLLYALNNEELIQLSKLDIIESTSLIHEKSISKRLSIADSKVIQNICITCDGLPLAIEWVVGQINSGRQSFEKVISSIVNCPLPTSMLVVINQFVMNLFTIY